MVIKRQVAGKDIEIELSPRELCDAYYEQEHNYDVEDVKVRFDDMIDDEFEDHGLTREYAEAHMDEIAYNKRRNMTKYEMSWEYALDEAIDTFWYEHGVSD